MYSHRLAIRIKRSGDRLPQLARNVASHYCHREQDRYLSDETAIESLILIHSRSLVFFSFSLSDLRAK